MSGDFITIIFLAVIAAFILFKLRNVLGQVDEDGSRRRPPERPAEPSQPENSRVIRFPEKTPEEEATVIHAQDRPETEAMKKMIPEVAEGFKEIASRDRDLTPEVFVQGASRAFDMILYAFSNGDKNALRSLLSDELYRQFCEEIDARAAAGEKLDTTLVSLSSADIAAAHMQGKAAYITIRFVTEQINIIRDKEGNVVSGNPSRIDKVEDIWTFTRNMGSSNPNWKLVETGNA